MGLEKQKYHLADLRKKIERHFTTQELQFLCFEIGVDWEELTGDRKRTKLISLIDHLYRRHQMENFLALLRTEKPHITWPKIFPGSLSTVIDTNQQSKGLSILDETLQEILHIHYPEVLAEIIQRGLYKTTINLSDLLKKIREYFDESELRDICFTLEIHYGQLEGGHYYDKARELISHCKRIGKLNDLIKLCKELRPHIIWDYE